MTSKEKQIVLNKLFAKTAMTKRTAKSRVGGERGGIQLLRQPPKEKPNMPTTQEIGGSMQPLRGFYKKTPLIFRLKSLLQRQTPYN